MSLKSTIYKMLRISNDINAIKKGKVTRRIGRRAAGKATGKLFKKIFG
ncbi:hypothetical protein [Virgibacillus alimentarius]|uniref:Phage protein n=1 Tax=Virgibacillus alimentarius TaxID=698769 RepID=A0ABS4SBH6_9BACI|nr:MULTISPECIES: hypothetical protein [Virgibacillus]MBP2258851.1 hypothetical protein [Virgibacillus alimentarius]HLR67053.1 hypothetical protein [Virgibacillus sp.]